MNPFVSDHVEALGCSLRSDLLASKQRVSLIRDLDVNLVPLGFDAVADIAAFRLCVYPSFP
jgi:hypothetical protein